MDKHATVIERNECGSSPETSFVQLKLRLMRLRSAISDRSVQDSGDVRRRGEGVPPRPPYATTATFRAQQLLGIQPLDIVVSEVFIIIIYLSLRRSTEEECSFKFSIAPCNDRHSLLLNQCSSNCDILSNRRCGSPV